MTTLDEILYLINSIDVISAIQVTPQKISITVTEESFWKILKIFEEKDLIFKFMEKREMSIDVHMLLSIRRITIGVFFRVIDYNPEFFSNIKTKFPSSGVYIQEILRNTSG